MVNLKSIDLLVHVSGPSDGKDDARYRAQAEAYVGFESGAVALSSTREGREATTRMGSKQQVEQEEFDNLQLLAHLSAPTRNVDDEKYRAQARAYIEFEAAAVSPKRGAYHQLHDTKAAQSANPQALAAVDTEIGSKTSSDLCDPSLTSQDIRELLEFADRRAQELEKQRQTDQRKTKETKPASDGAEGHGRTEDLLPPCSIPFGSSFDWTSTPCLPPMLKRRPGPVEAVTTGPSFSKRIRSPLQSQAQTSSYDQSSLYSQSHVLASAADANSSRGEQGQKENLHLEDAEQTRRNSASELSNSQAGTKEDGADASVVRISSGQDLSGYPDHQSQDASRSYSSFANKPIRQEDIDDATGLNSGDESTLFHRHAASLKIHPPLPPINGEPFPRPSSLTTPSLELLARKVDINHRRFRPQDQSRSLQSFDRGHWICDLQRCGISSRDLRRRLWDFLKEFIEAGRAGWGVWVALQGNTDFLDDSEAATSTTTSIGTGSTTTDGDSRGKPVAGPSVRKYQDDKKCLGQRRRTTSKSDQQLSGKEVSSSNAATAEIKIYCWGVVAMHIYALLWVASEGHLRKGQGCRWIDAKGEVVITM